MRLIERESQLAALYQYAGEASQGQGRLVLISGEAGVGKWPGPLGHGQVPQPHGRQEGRLFDLGRHRRNHLHRRSADGRRHGRALRQE